MDIFGDLSYNKENRAFIGRPVKEIEALYKKKEEDFNYVVDSRRNLNNAFNDLKYNDVNKGLVVEAKKHLDDSFAQFDETGDYENKVLETNKIADNLANKFGLKAISQDYQAQAARNQELEKAVQEGKISSERANQYRYEDQTNYKGVKKDEELGTYKPAFDGSTVIQQHNWSEKVADIVKGWKADTLPLTNETGQVIKQNADGTGYIELGSTIEQVSAAEVARAAKSYLMNDPAFNSEFAEDLRFEVGNNEITLNDIAEVSKQGVSTDISNQFKSTTVEGLRAEMEEKGISPAQLFAQIRKDQKLNSAIQLGVDKESYTKYDAKYVKDWLSEEGGKSSKGKTPDLSSVELGTVMTVTTEGNTHKVNLDNNSKVYTTASTNVAKLEEELKNGNSLDPATYRQKEAELKQQKHLVAASVENYNYVLGDRGIQNAIKTMAKDLTGLNVSLSLFGETTAVKNTADNVYRPKQSTYMVDGVDEPIIKASEGSIQNLIVQNLQGNLDNQNLDNFINPNVKPEFRQEMIGKLKTQIERLSTVAKNMSKTGDLDITEDYTTLIAPNLSPDATRKTAYGQFNAQLATAASDPSFYGTLGEVFTGLPLEQYLDEQGVKDYDLSKAKVSTSLQAVRRPDGTGYNNMLRVVIPVKDGKDVVINTFSGDKGINTKYNEVLNEQRQSLLNKRNQVGVLKESEQQQLDALNLNRYENSNFALDIDLKNWVDKRHGEVTPITFWELDGKPLEAFVKSFKYDSPGEGMHLLVNKTGDFYSINPRTKEQKILSAAELKAPENKDFQPMGGNQPKDLKRSFANLVSESINFNQVSDTTPKGTPLVDATSIYGKDIVGKNTYNYVAEDLVDYHRKLKEDLTGLQPTDLFRPANSTVGAKDSLHKEARATDYRMNSDSIKLAQMDATALKAYNIKSAAIHDEGKANEHVHVEFY